MYRQGDILLVPIPFTDLSTNKRRPVLVISNDDYNNITEDVIVAAITSNLADKVGILQNGRINQQKQKGGFVTKGSIAIQSWYTAFLFFLKTKGGVNYGC